MYKPDNKHTWPHPFDSFAIVLLYTLKLEIKLSSRVRRGNQLVYFNVKNQDLNYLVWIYEYMKQYSCVYWKSH
jgi:hypothetical protein